MLKKRGVWLKLRRRVTRYWFCSHIALTLSPLNKLSSAKFPVCFYSKSASMLLNVGENVVWLSNNLDPGETTSGVSPRTNLFAYDTLVVLGGLRFNTLLNSNLYIRDVFSYDLSAHRVFWKSIGGLRTIKIRETLVLLIQIKK